MPDNEEWKCWVDAPQPFWFPMSPFGLTDAQKAAINRKRLVRIPCSANDAQNAAKRLSFDQKTLLTFSKDIEPGPNLANWYPPTSNDRPLRCILPTPELFDQLYLESDIKVANTKTFMDKQVKLPALASNEYNNHINELINNAWAAGTIPSTSKQGNCGKIWALGQGMNTANSCKGADGKAHWTFSAINHGFYHGKNGTAQGQMTQYRGKCHNRDHIDYSQVFICVAGWCLVEPPREAWRWMETAAVYLDRKPKEQDHESLARLVRTEPGPVPGLSFEEPSPTDRALIHANNAAERAK